MKILKLSFKNLNSLRGSFSIDFENGPLAEAGLFAITGPTGAGKTTILDAITLGLFGKAARYDNDRGSPEDVMSRGTGECFAEVTFGCNSGVYVARWDLTRARKKADGKVQGAKRQLATVEGTILEEKIRQVDERVVSLTGLDYGRFLRSVLPAQGRFKEFLDADSKDRGELLEKITGTEIYSNLSMAAHEQARTRQTEIDQARQSLAGIKLLDGEQVEAYGAQRVELEKQYAACADKLKQVEVRIGLYEHVCGLAKTGVALDERKRVWEKQEEAFLGDAKRMEAYERAAPLLSELTHWKALQEREGDGVSKLNELDTVAKKKKGELGSTYARVLEACVKERSVLAKELGELDKRLSRDEKARSGANAWLKENHKSSALAVGLGQIRDAANSVGASNQSLKTHDEKGKTTLARQKKVQQDELDLSKQQKLASEQLKTSEEGLLKQQRALSELLKNQTKEQWAARLRKEQDCLALAKRLRDPQNAYLSETEVLKEKATSLAEESELLESKSLDLKKIELQLKQERERLTDKETIFRQAQAIASLEEKRSQLVEGEPCDLCGAKEHPYATGELPSKSESEKAFDTQRKRVEVLEGEEKALLRALDVTKERVAALVKIRADLEKRIAKASQLFVELIGELTINLEVGDRDGLVSWGRTLQTKVAELEISLKEIETEEKSVTECEKRVLEVRSEVKSLGGQIDQLQRVNRDIVDELKSEKAKTLELSGIQAKALAVFSDLIRTWRDDTVSVDGVAAVVRDLEARAQLYSEKKQEESDLRNGIEKLQQSIVRLREESERLDVEVSEWTLKFEANGEDLSLERTDREFVNLDRIDVRRRYCELALEGATRSRLEADGKKAELESLRKEIGGVVDALRVAALARGFASIEDLNSVLLSEGVLVGLRKMRRDLDDEKASIDALRKQNEASRLELKSKVPPTEEEVVLLRTEVVASQTSLKAFAEQLGEIKNALEADRKARQEQGAELLRIEELEKLAQPWMILRDLIGSADGSKFSRFAQGLTLGQLVAHANRHLCELNPRYRIRRVANADLELEIVDCYEADAVRPTRSLSGGESFLVSLGLALGLSELAGRNTKIQSLFIDEGFGSLDGDTLDVALSALESLRLQNRSIGVISHVEDLKVRLGTQIQVRRKSDGHAELLVVDA